MSMISQYEMSSGHLPLQFMQLEFSGKLVGRESEKQAILEGLERTRQKHEIILIHGPPGSGRTALAKSISTLENVFFVGGKFEQARSSRPFGCLVDAISELCDKVAESADAQKVCASIQTHLGSDHAVLLQLVPSLGKVLDFDGKSRRESLLRTKSYRAVEWGFERIKYLVRCIVRAVASPDRPLVLFFDDIQWGDAASLDLILRLAKNDNANDGGGLMIVLAHCHDKLQKHDPNNAALRFLHQVENGRVTHVHCKNLSLQNVHHLVSDLMTPSKQDVGPLAECVYRKTNGNAFFVVEMLRHLHDEGILFCSFHGWDWDMDRILLEANTSENVVDLVVSNLSRLTDSTRCVLRIASCLGAHFCGHMMEYVLKARQRNNGLPVMSSDAVQDALAEAVEAGILDRRSGVDAHKFKFAHDRIFQATYESLVPTQQDELHYSIGTILKTFVFKPNPSNKDRTQPFLVGVDQLNRSVSLIQKEKAALLELAQLNFQASQKLKDKSALFLAEHHLKMAFGLMDEETRWTDKHYSFTLELAISLAEIQCALGNHQDCASIVKEVLANARDDSQQDKMRAQITLMESFKAQDKLDESIDMALEMLTELGETLPLHAVSKCIARTRHITKGLTNDDIMALPPMKDVSKMTAMKVLSGLFFAAWFSGRDELVATIGVCMVRLTLAHGMDMYSPHGFALWGIVVGDREAFRWARLVLGASDRWAETAPRAMVVTHSFLMHLKRPVQDSIRPLMRAYRSGMKHGDTEYALLGVLATGGIHFLSGLALEPIHKDMQEFTRLMLDYNATCPAVTYSIYHQGILNFLYPTENPVVLKGAAFQEDAECCGPVAKETSQFIGLMLAVFFGDWEVAGTLSDLLQTRQHQTLYCGCFLRFYRGLANVVLAQRTKKRLHVRQARQTLKLFRHEVQDTGAMNSHHMLLFLEAEHARLDKRKNVMDAYGRAILAARRSGFLHHAALCNERAGSMMLLTRDLYWGKHHLSEAFRLYQDWGSQSKMEQLETLYPFLKEGPMASCSSGFTESSSEPFTPFHLKGRKRYDTKTATLHRMSLVM